jgi:hypothetical protein
MQHEVMKVLKHLFVLLKSYDVDQIHNMFALMFNLQFKHVHVV